MHSFHFASVFLLAVLGSKNLVRVATAFTTTNSPRSHMIESTSFSMAPKFNADTQRWEATTPEDLEGTYDIFETVVRNGPLPFIQRVANADGT